MKIAIIYDPIYPFIIGGGEKRNWEIARRLVKRGHRVYLIGMKFWRGSDRIVKEGVDIIGICPAIKVFNKKGKRNLYQPVYFAIFVFFHLLFNSYDIIDTPNFPYFHIFAIKFAGIFKKKTNLIITWFEIWGREYWNRYAGSFVGGIGFIIEKLISGITPANIFISDFTRRRAQKILGMNGSLLKVVNLGIDYENMVKFRGNTKMNRVICAGRLVKHKRVDLLLEAFAEVLKEKKNIELKIIGEGPEKNYLIELTENLGIKSKVEFKGYMEEDDLKREIAFSKIFVFPSEIEGIFVLIESMALGTPVVAKKSEYSAAKDIIEDGIDGLLFSNTEELKRNIIILFDNSILYNSISSGGYKKAEGFDWERIVIPEIELFYKSLVN